MVLCAIHFDDLGLAFIALLTSVASAVGLASRAYRRSASREIQPFAAYVVGTTRLYVGRYFRPALARQLGLRRYVTLKLQAFPSKLAVPSLQHVRLDLDSAYVRLTLSASDRRPIPDEVLLDPALGSALVFGEPGSGKSSLTRKLFRESCKRASAQPHRGRLPVHLELGQLPWETLSSDDPKACGKWLLGHAEQTVRDVPGVHGHDFIFGAFLRGPGLLVFLDGLDEVPAGHQSAAGMAIRELVTRLRLASQGTTVIVTARTQLRDALSESLLDAFQNVYSLQPFTPADVFAFLRRWPFQDAGLQESSRIFADLGAHATFGEMCTNPLILSMYVAHDQRHAGEAPTGTRSIRLPETRPEFYDAVVGELLLFRRAEQGGRAVGGSQLRRTREVLLGRIALDHLLRSNEPANSVSWVRAIDITREVLGCSSTVEAEVALRELAIETGIFAEERRRETLRFMHLTLCEYLAAKELAETSEQTLADLLARLASTTQAGETRDRRLWETTVFALAMLGRLERTNTLNTAVFAQSRELLLRVVRESQAYDLPVFHDTVKDLVDDLRHTPTTAWNDAWFGLVRLLGACLSDAARLDEVRKLPGLVTVESMLDAIVNSDRHRFARLFDMYLEASPAEALRLADQYQVREEEMEPQRLVAAMEHPSLIALAMNKVVAQGGAGDRWILPLAEAGLRYELVAGFLRDNTAPDHLIEYADRLPQECWWHKVGPASGSLYGVLLALASAKVDSPMAGYANGLPRLGLLAGLHPFERRFELPANPSVLSAGFLATVATMMGTVAWLNGPARPLLLAFTVLMGVMPSVVLGRATYRRSSTGLTTRELRNSSQQELLALVLNLRRRSVPVMHSAAFAWLDHQGMLFVPTNRPISNARAVVELSPLGQPRRATLRSDKGYGTLPVMFGTPVEQVCALIDSAELLAIQHDCVVNTTRTTTPGRAFREIRNARPDRAVVDDMPTWTSTTAPSPTTTALTEHNGEDL